MESRIVSDEEIEEITGFKSPAKQCQKLMEFGIFFIKRKDGRPRTTWDHFNNPSKSSKKTSNEILPNFGAI